MPSDPVWSGRPGVPARSRVKVCGFVLGLPPSMDYSSIFLYAYVTRARRGSARRARCARWRSVAPLAAPGPVEDDVRASCSSQTRRPGGPVARRPRRRPSKGVGPSPFPSHHCPEPEGEVILERLVERNWERVMRWHSRAMRSAGSTLRSPENIEPPLIFRVYPPVRVVARYGHPVLLTF